LGEGIAAGSGIKINQWLERGQMYVRARILDIIFIGFFATSLFATASKELIELAI
jgi:hypothetical protein